MTSRIAASRYIAEGLQVLPVWSWNDDGTCRCGGVDASGVECRSGKHPVAHLAPRGLKDATTEPSMVERWWPDGARHGVAVRTTATCWVLDEDERGAAEALQLPPTRTAQTKSGGRHFWFRGGPVANSTKRIPGCDTRGAGGYVVVPPTLGYAWLDEREPATAPPALLALLAPPLPIRSTAAVAVPARDAGASRFGLAVLRSACERIEAASEGCRHDTLRSRARLVAGYVATGEIEEGLARRCLASAAAATGLLNPEIEAAIEWGIASGLEAPLAKPRRRR